MTDGLISSTFKFLYTVGVFKFGVILGFMLGFMLGYGVASNFGYSNESHKGLASNNEQGDGKTRDGMPRSTEQDSCDTNPRDANLDTDTSTRDIKLRRFPALDEKTILEQSERWQAGGLKVLVVGRSNTGKSTLIKALFEETEVSKEFTRNHQNGERNIVKKALVLSNINISVEKMSCKDGISALENSEDFHLIVYTIKATEPRFRPDDERTIKGLVKLFGDDIRNKIIFVLTYANHVTQVNERGEAEQNQEILIITLSRWEAVLNEKLNYTFKPEQIVLAGLQSEQVLYDIHWPSEVLTSFYHRLEETQRRALARVCENYWIRSLQGNGEHGNCAS